MIKKFHAVFASLQAESYRQLLPDPSVCTVKWNTGGSALRIVFVHIHVFFIYITPLLLF